MVHSSLELAFGMEEEAPPAPCFETTSRFVMILNTYVQSRGIEKWITL